MSITTIALSAALGFPIHGHNVQVHTMVASEVAWSAPRTVRVMAGAQYLGGLSPGAANPRLNDDVTNQAIRGGLVSGLERRGYAVSDADPDAVLVYYLAVPLRHDVSDWDYNYLWRPSWWRNWGPGSEDATPLEYRYGAIMIEMRDARSNEVLWRGHAMAEVPQLESRYTKNLNNAVAALLARMPEE
jgi:hypothetical protein